jgi:hypothetical protein
MFSDFFKSHEQTYQESTEIQLIPSNKLLIVGVVLMDQNQVKGKQTMNL